jgi:hypothetical protein
MLRHKLASEMAYLTNQLPTLKVIGNITKAFACLVLLASLILPYELSHLHTNVDQETDCLYCQIEQSPGSGAAPIAVTVPTALTAISANTLPSADLPRRVVKQHRQRAPPTNFSYI